MALEFGGNDCDMDWAAISANLEIYHSAKTPLNEFEIHYANIIDSVVASGTQPVILTLPPLDATRYFSWVSKGLNADNILHWLGDVEHIYRWHEICEDGIHPNEAGHALISDVIKDYGSFCLA